jgi:23S rRNA (cytidine1920-2'-O)/16S rRNA (cytidine1409-2'-O)-methyltransferase
VRRGLAQSRQQARALVVEGRVTVAGAPTRKPDRQVAPDEAVVVSGPPPRYVSRGGDKLAGALAHFGITPRGRWVDVGASTGGFTDCLLQHGAAQVVAVDVGRGQLHQRLRHDDRVVVHERTHVRDLAPGLVGGPADGVVADLSFISLGRALGPILAVAAPRAPLLLLVKPQFEAGRSEVSRGRGVIRDPAVWTRVLDHMIDAVVAEGASMMGLMVSPLRGSDGNVEFFLYALAARDGDASPWAEPAWRAATVADLVATVDPDPGPAR